VTNNSTVDETGPVTLGDNTGATASFSNKGTYNLDNDSGIGVGTGPSTFTNAAGAILAKIGGTGGSHIAPKVVNSNANAGAISVQTGTLSFDGGGSSNAAAFSVASGATLAFGGGTFTVMGGSYNIAGTTLISGGTADFSGTTPTNFGSLLSVT